MNGQSGKHFSSVEEFYNATRPEKIDALCRELYAFEQPEKAKRGIFPETDGEWISWKRSLPDFAELLCDQEGYGRRTAEEGRRLERALEAEIALLQGLKDSPELAALRKTDSFAGLCGGGSDAVRKAVNKSSVTAIKTMEDCFGMLSGRSLAALIRSLEKQKAAIAGVCGTIEAAVRVYGLPPMEVDLEYLLPDPGGDRRKAKRIDVLLSSPEKGAYVIIELKQWTEDSVNVNVFEGEDGDPDCLVSAGNGTRTQPHPAVKVRDVYKPLLQAQAGPDARIRCFVYLHDQMYADGELFKVRWKGIDISDHCPDPENILYTRLYYRQLLFKISASL